MAYGERRTRQASGGHSIRHSHGWSQLVSLSPLQCQVCPLASSAACSQSLISWQTPSGRASSGSMGTHRTTSSPRVRLGAGLDLPHLSREVWGALRGSVSPSSHSIPYHGCCFAPHLLGSDFLRRLRKTPLLVLGAGCHQSPRYVGAGEFGALEQTTSAPKAVPPK